MKKTRFSLLFPVMLCLLLFPKTSVRADCFAVVVGKKASADGSVLVGHNEQNGGRVILNYRCVPGMKHKPGKEVTLKNGGKLPEAAQTNAMIWQQMPGLDFSDSYFNEHGVMVASNACSTREDSCEELVKRGGITDGGIGYMLRRLVAQRARTAKEGVTLAGELVSRFGYYASGRSYIIADPGEAWVFSVARGKRWIAQRCPDDGVVLLANVHIIGAEADLKDKENVVASPGLVEYAIKRGWYDPDSGKRFSFKDAFKRPPAKGSFEKEYGCDPRQWYAQSMVIGKFIELPVGKPLPFSVKPSKKMKVGDVAKILRSRGEGIPDDALKKKEKDNSGTPASISALAAICGRNSQEGAVYQLRSGLPKEIGCVVWRTTGPPDCSALTPWYLGITETPGIYYRPGDIREQLKLEHHFNYPAEKMKPDMKYAFDTFDSLAEQVYHDYGKAVKEAENSREPFEKMQFEVQSAFEEVALNLYKKDKALAGKFLTDFTRARALLALDKARERSRKLKDPGRSKK